mmetsp:Transcript_3092/g.7091  ORF Transcript_3092/g.7091 Transcript_3092/m.7091 type:complete len:217 (-) Transcript_3092:1122-1772(-)
MLPFSASLLILIAIFFTRVSCSQPSSRWSRHAETTAAPSLLSPPLRASWKDRRAKAGISSLRMSTSTHSICRTLAHLDALAAIFLLPMPQTDTHSAKTTRADLMRQMATGTLVLLSISNDTLLLTSESKVESGSCFLGVFPRLERLLAGSAGDMGPGADTFDESEMRERLRSPRGDVPSSFSSASVLLPECLTTAGMTRDDTQYKSVWMGELSWLL